MTNSEDERAEPIELSDANALTPRQLLMLAGRFTIGSWLTVVGTLIALVVGAFGVGWSYRDGSAPEFAYFLHQGSPTPYEEKIRRENQEAFAESYSNLVNWRTLQAIAAGIAEDSPDGLESKFEIVASLLAQVRSTRGSAAFLAGDTEIKVQLNRSDDGFELKWSEGPSIVPRVAKDAGYMLSDDELRLVNSNLNWAQFSYLDDALERAVIYRELDGTFGLVIRDEP